jgi:hypothetical protein
LKKQQQQQIFRMDKGVGSLVSYNGTMYKDTIGIGTIGTIIDKKGSWSLVSFTSDIGSRKYFIPDDELDAVNINGMIEHIKAGIASLSSQLGSSSSSGRQTLEDIRASVGKQKQPEKQIFHTEVDGDDIPTSLLTSNVELISHAHGRQRRAERNIQRKELQAAIKHGEKEVANPGRDGSKRWRYTHKGVVYITDETSRHEVTSWRIDGEDDDDDDDEARPAEVQLGGKGCHAVLVIDDSGSMRKEDVPGYKSRAHAVYECLIRDFLKEQLKSGGADDVVVTLITMNDDARVLFRTQPLNTTLINYLQMASRRRPRYHGNYIPALDMALDVMRNDAANRSSVLLLFFSDGAPSDQQSMKCEHGVRIFDIDRKVDPKMKHSTKGSAWHCRQQIFEKVEKECCLRVKRIGQVFGQDKVIFRTLAFGPLQENFALLEKMAAVLPRGEFQKLGLNASNLRTAFSSLSSSLLTLRTEGGTKTLTRRSDKVVERNQQKYDHESYIYGQKGWWIYARDDFVGKYKYHEGSNEKGQLKKVVAERVEGIAFRSQPFAEGAERFVYQCCEIEPYVYYSPANMKNIATRGRLRLVAKEAKDIENHRRSRKFHETFSRIQTDAANLAKIFSSRLPSPRREWAVTFLDTYIYGMYDGTYPKGQAWILVEPELDGKFTKWNNNAGDVRRPIKSKKQESKAVDFGIIEESDEDDDDDDGDFSSGRGRDDCGLAMIEIDDIPQAFSHFTYEYSNRKKLVCDLQGVWNADDGFVLTDPVIHHVSPEEGRKHRNGATDKGFEGVKKFFTTHQCNALCTKLGLHSQIFPSILPELINMTHTTSAPSHTQMPGSITQHPHSNSFDLPGGVANLPLDPVDGGFCDTNGDDDDPSVLTPNSKVNLPWMEYNIKLLMTNKQGNSDLDLQYATMDVLHYISYAFGSDVCILDGTGKPMSDFAIQATSTFRSKFHVGRSKGNSNYMRSPTAWLIFTLQSNAPLKDIRRHPQVSATLSRVSCKLIHHQWSVDMVNTTSLGFFVQETPTYKLSSTFEGELRSFLTKKSEINIVKLPQFRIALTLVRARLAQPGNATIFQDACIAFELQVPVHQRKFMDEIICNSFQYPDATNLKFVYYKQRHVHPAVFFKAVQMQRKHDQSHRVVAVEGIHPDQYFAFELTLRQHFPQIKAVLPTSKTHQSNFYGSPIGRYNLLCLTKDFASLAQQLSRNFPNLYHQHLHNQGTDFKQRLQAPRVVSRLPRSDDSSGSTPSLNSRSTFFTYSASFFENHIQLDWSDCKQYPQVVEVPSLEPSVTSGIYSTGC